MYLLEKKLSTKVQSDSSTQREKMKEWGNSEADSNNYVLINDHDHV